MIIASKIDERTKEQMDKLLSSGAYRDYSEIIATAVNNLALLHDEMGEDRSLVFGANKTEKREKSSSSRDSRPKPPRHEVRDAEPTNSLLRGLWIFHRTSLESVERPTAFAPAPDDVLSPGERVPLDRWIFGQYSKLLPAKASVRALANLEIRDDLKLPLDETASVIASNAAALGDYLSEVDDRRRLQRDDALAVGFPSSSENAEKSRLRYANQFVGSLNKAGVLSGLLIDLKLMNLRDTRTPRIQLTQAGWDFALLPNPVLDEPDPTGNKFTPEERAFLLAHIGRNVPIEASAYRVMLRAILNGDNTPDRLDAALKPYIPAHREPPITPAFVTTQRSGTISRMADLGLVIRVRDGVRVSYAPTETGQAFAQTPAAA